MKQKLPNDLSGDPMTQSADDPRRPCWKSDSFYLLSLTTIVTLVSDLKKSDLLSLLNGIIPTSLTI